MRLSLSRNIAFTWVFGFFGVVATVAMLSYNVYFHRSGDLVKAEQLTRILVDVATHEVERVLFGVEQIFTGVDSLLERSPDAKHPLSPSVRQELERHKSRNGQMMDLLVLDPRGRIVHWTGPESGPVPEVADRDYARVHLEGSDEGLFIGEPLLSRVHEGEWFFGVSRAVRDAEGRLRWIAVAIVHIAHFHARYQGLELPPKSGLFLASPRGTIYVRIPNHLEAIGTHAPFAERFWRSGKAMEGGYNESCREGTPCVATARRVDGYPLVAVVGVTVDQALAVWRDDALIILAIGLFVSAGIVILTMKLVSMQRGQQRTAAELERMAHHDYLTGLLNRRELMTRAGEELERSRRYQHALSVVMMDVDHFKRVNDFHGHPVGDRALREVAAVLTDCSRGSDVAGRYGGEEFLLVLPETDIEGARIVAEKVRTQLERAVIECDDGPLHVTASLGVVESDGVESLEGLLCRADEWLYRAKEGGRNRVEAEERGQGSGARDQGRRAFGAAG